MDTTEKKRGRPSTSEKNKKQKKRNFTLQELMAFVSKNLNSPFSDHNIWLQENLPENLEDLYKLRVFLEPKKSNFTQSEIDNIISRNILYLNGNDKSFTEIHQLFDHFVNDHMEEHILTLLENYRDKVNFLVEKRNEKVCGIIRKSIGIKMFPELLDNNNAKED